MFDGVSSDFLKDGDGRRLRLPGPKAGGFRAVEYHPRQIERARRRIGADRVRAEFGVAPRGELTQRHRGAGAAGNVGEAIRRGEFGCGELLEEQRHEIVQGPDLVDPGVDFYFRFAFNQSLIRKNGDFFYAFTSVFNG